MQEASFCRAIQLASTGSGQACLKSLEYENQARGQWKSTYPHTRPGTEESLRIVRIVCCGLNECP